MKTVLVIDRGRVARAMVARLLGPFGCRVREACEVAELRRGGIAESPDLVLLDAGLPPEDGRTPLEQLRTDPKTAAVPVILLATDEQRAATRESGASPDVRVLVKPFRRPDLEAAVRPVLGEPLPIASREADPGTVLVVDESEAVLDAARTALQSSLRVLTARSGDAALETLLRERPGVLVVDASMRSGAGGHMLGELRHRGRVACLALAGADDDSARERARRAGCHAVLEKPVAGAALREAVLAATGLVASAEGLLALCLDEAGDTPVLRLPRAAGSGLSRVLEPLSARLRELARAGARGLVIEVGSGGDLGIDAVHGLVRVVRDASQSGLPVVLAMAGESDLLLAAAAELRAVPLERSTGEALARLG